MNGLSIRKDSCALDFLSLGALVHRLDPGVIPFRKARSVDIHVSGGEYNVAANLSDCFGLRTGIATAMVNYGIGELVQTRVREAGVTPFYTWFEHDGFRRRTRAIPAGVAAHRQRHRRLVRQRRRLAKGARHPRPGSDRALET